MNNKYLFLIIAFSLFLSIVFGQDTSFDIRLNQIGFFPNSRKQAAITNTQTDTYKILTSDLSSIVFEGKCLPESYYASSNEHVYIADFTLLQEPGNYVLVVDGLGKSVPFTIHTEVFSNLSKASIKAFYYNRASIYFCIYKKCSPS